MADSFRGEQLLYLIHRNGGGLRGCDFEEGGHLVLRYRDLKALRRSLGLLPKIVGGLAFVLSFVPDTILSPQ
ncbi:MAG: hypothetical protein JRI90_13880 [Deltaproteobacteria bacterium]|nr:hypothetical protein [Deltaproteobacteria bacterium]